MKEIYYTCTWQKKLPLLLKITHNTFNTNLWATEHVNYMRVDKSKQLVCHNRSHRKYQNIRIFGKEFAFIFWSTMANWKFRRGNYQHRDVKQILTTALKTWSGANEWKERKKADKPTALNEINGDFAISLKTQVGTGQKIMGKIQQTFSGYLNKKPSKFLSTKATE